MKVLIAGCGYLGTYLAKDFLKNNAEVWGLRRNAEALKPLVEIGLEPIAADLLNPSSLTALPWVDAVVLCQAPQKSGGDSYQKTYHDATVNLLSALNKKPPKKLLLVSSTSVYGVSDGAWVDEKTETNFDTQASDQSKVEANCLLETEKIVLQSSIASLVIRLGGIYGPGRNRLRPLKEGRIKPSFSDIYSNRIHVEDAATAIQLLLEKGKEREIYLGVDDKPSTQKEFYNWLCDRLALGKGDSQEDSRPASRVSNKRCSNQKIKNLGMSFKYPSFIEGYEPLIQEVSAS